MIAVDDLRPMLGCYGVSVVRSPNIDRLAASGIVFERAYCQHASCAPSRSSLLSGARPATNGVHGNATALDKAMPGVLTLPRHFRNHGYETISLGKIYHHPTDDLKGWSVPPRAESGAWAGRGYLAAASRAVLTDSDDPVPSEIGDAHPDDPRKGRRGPAFEQAEVPDSAYPDGVTLELALRELERVKNKPFFLGVGFLRPHLPFNAPKRYWDLYAPDRLPLPSRSMWPEGTPSLAMSSSQELRSYVGIPREGPVDPGTMRSLIQGYCASVSYVDALIGRLLKRLDDLGLRDNTAIALWGDHGWKLGDYGAWSKGTAFEIDARAPLIISDPGMVRRGVSTQGLVELVDLYPTLAELCGLPVPDHCEGSSMAPLLREPGRRWKRAAFTESPRQRGVKGESLRTAKWRYTEWIRMQDGEVLDRELYDHSAGPIASANLASHSAQREVVSELSALLDQGRGWRGVRSELAR